MKNGFTLIEVLVALVIVAICFTAVLTGISVNVRNAIRLQDKTAALFVAENIAAVAKMGNLVEDTEGNEMMLDKNWHWSAKFFNTTDPSLRRLVMTVDNMTSTSHTIQIDSLIANKQ